MVVDCTGKVVTRSGDWRPYVDDRQHLTGFAVPDQIPVTPEPDVAIPIIQSMKPFMHSLAGRKKAAWINAVGDDHAVAVILKDDRDQLSVVRFLGRSLVRRLRELLSASTVH